MRSVLRLTSSPMLIAGPDAVAKRRSNESLAYKNIDAMLNGVCK
jgi:hypothetical protein